MPLLALRGALGLAAGNLMAIGLAHLARVRKPDRAFAPGHRRPGRLQYRGAVAVARRRAILGPDRPVRPAGPVVRRRAAGRHATGQGRAGPQIPSGFERVPAPGHVFVALAANTLFFIAQSGVWAYLERIAAGAGLAPDVVGRTLALSVSLALLGPLAASLLADRYGRALPLAIVVAGQLGALWLLQGPFTAAVFLVAATGFQVCWNFAVPYLVAIVAALDRAGRYIVLATPLSGCRHRRRSRPGRLPGGRGRFRTGCLAGRRPQSWPALSCCCPMP